MSRHGLSRLKAVLPWLLLAAVAGGCARARAADVPVGPPLAIPAPPERVLAPLEEEPLAASPGRTDTAIAAPEISQEPPPAPVTRSSGDRGRQSPPPVAPAAAPVSNAAPAEVARQVRPQSAPEEATLQRDVTELLNGVKANLNRAPNAPKEKREEILGLLEVAQKALIERDYSLAKTVAVRALTLSTALLR